VNKAARVESLLNAIEAAEGESYGYENDGSLSSERAAALDAYYGKNTSPAPEGNSQVVSRDLFDTVETIAPSLVRIFAGSGDEVVKFEPIGPEDEEQARQETLYVNHVITERNNWQQVFHDWAKDALLTKNAYCLAYWDDSKQVEYETYARQSDDAFALLMQDDGIEVLEHSAEPDEEAAAQQEQQWQQAAMQWQQMAMQAQEQGQPIPPEPQRQPPPMLHAVKIRRTNESGRVCLKVLPPERCLVHQSTPDYTLKDCDFFQYWDEVSISSLRKMGFDIEDDIDADSTGRGESEEDAARDLYGEERQDGWEPAMRKVRARMCWIKHDYDGDGISELQYVMVVGRTMLYREECNRIPVGSIVATPVPHRHIGVSMADVVTDIQETKTAILRQGIDNLFHANNPRLFLNEGRVNLDDALVSRPGGVIRGVQGEAAVFGQDIAPIVIPNIFPQAVQGLDYMDQVRENRTGANRYFTGTDQNALNKTASGIAQLTGMAAQRVEQIARMIAPSVEYLFGVVHELILKHGHKSEVVRLAGSWTTVDPSQWRKRRDMKCSVGLGSGNKEVVMGQLMTIFQAQMAVMPLGIVDGALIKNTLTEMVKAASLANPALFFKDGEPTPPPPDPQMVKVQADIEKSKADFELEQQRLQADLQKQQAELEIAREKGEVEIALKVKEMQLRELELQFKERELALKERELGIKAQAAEIDAAIKVETTKHQMTKDAVDSDREERRLGLESQHRERETALTAGAQEREFQLKERESQLKARDSENQGKREDRKVSIEEKKAEREAKQEASKAKETSQDIEATLAKVLEGSKTVSIERIKDANGKLVGARRTLANGKTEEVPIA